MLLAFGSPPSSSAIVVPKSSDFYSGSLEQFWTWEANGGSYQLQDAATTDAALAITVPAASNHDNYSSAIVTPWMYQTVSDVDFVVEVKFLSAVTQAGSGIFREQGLIVWESDTKWMRFDANGTNSTKTMFCGTTNTTTTQQFNETVTVTAPMWLRIVRIGDDFTCTWSDDGDTFNAETGSTFEFIMTVNRIGVMAGNVGAGSAPEHTAVIDYFFNNASPIVPEDIATIVSDDFSGGIGGGHWSQVDPLTGSTFSAQEPVTDDHVLRIAVPSGSNHVDANDQCESPRLVQAVSDTDFQIQAKFRSSLDTATQFQGIYVEESSTTYIRFVLHFDAVSGYLLLVNYADFGGAGYSQKGAIAAGINDKYVRVTRTVNQWDAVFSSDGVNWSSPISFTQALAVTQVGVMAGNYHSTPASAPALTCDCDYFFNMASPISPEDGESAPSSGLTFPETGSGNWFVSLTGGTTASGSGGGSLEDPWSISHAAANAASDIQPGDTVWIRAGRYYSAPEQWNLTGTSANRITVRGFPREKVIFDAYNGVPAGTAWHFNPGANHNPPYNDYLDFRNLAIDNSDPASRQATATGSLTPPGNRGQVTTRASELRMINVISTNQANGIAHYAHDLYVPATSPKVSINDRVGGGCFNCIAYNNGWMDIVRQFGHGLYIQHTNTAPTWTSSTLYRVNNHVLNSGTYYRCTELHTSSGSFATDSAKWTSVGATMPRKLMNHNITFGNYDFGYHEYKEAPSGATDGITSDGNISFLSGAAAGIPIAWNAGTNYKIAEACLYSGVYYRSLQTPNTNKTPASQPEYWGSIGTTPYSRTREYLIGGGTGVSSDITTQNNVSYQTYSQPDSDSPAFVSIWTNGNLRWSMHGNYWHGQSRFNNDITWNETLTNNHFVGSVSADTSKGGAVPAEVSGETNGNIVESSDSGQEIRVFELGFIDEFEENVGHISVHNWSAASSATVDLTSVLSDGETFEVLHVFDLVNPVLEGTFSDSPGTVSVPLPPAGGPHYPKTLPRAAGMDPNCAAVTAPNQYAAFIVKRT